MGLLSFALVLFLFAPLSVASPQGPQTQLPAITGPGSQESQCGGCYVVADVAGIVFGTETFTQTNTALVSIGVGANGTNITSTISITAAAVPFTFDPTSLTPGVLAFNSLGPTLTISGVELTSPTAYDVFTAYSITSTLFLNGACVVNSGSPTILPTAIKIQRPPNAPADFDSYAEDQFISSVGVPTCSAGGVNSVQTSQIPVSQITINATTVGPIRASLTAQAESTPSVSTVSATARAKTTASSSVISTAIVIVPITTPLSLPTASTTKTSVISAGKTIIIVSNSTYLQTGSGASATIVPFKGEAANMRMDLISSWLLWGSGIFGTLMALCAL